MLTDPFTNPQDLDLADSNEILFTIRRVSPYKGFCYLQGFDKNDLPVWGKEEVHFYYITTDWLSALATSESTVYLERLVDGQVFWVVLPDKEGIPKELNTVELSGMEFEV